jgi:hypothetical protein
MSNRPQYDVYNNNTVSVPNMYFLANEEANYNASSAPQDYVNPISIKNNCATQAQSNSYLIDPSNEEDEIAMTGGNNYNNFLWKYATNRLDDNTEIKQSSNSTSTYGQINDSAKNQLEYLGCQVLKNTNKIYDKNGISLTRIDQVPWPRVAAFLAFFALNFSFIAKSIGQKSSWIKLFTDISTKVNVSSRSDKIKFVIIVSVMLLVPILVLYYGSMSNYIFTNTNEQTGDGYTIYDNDDENNNASVGENNAGLTVSTILIISFSLIALVVLISFFHRPNWAWRSRSAAFGLPLLCIMGIYMGNYFSTSTISRWFSAEDSSTNTCKNINEESYDTTKVIPFLLILYVVCLLFYFGLVIVNKSATFNPVGTALLAPLAVIVPLLIVMFEFTFSMLEPILYLFVVVFIRIAVYLLGLVSKSRVTAVLFNYPTAYFDKLKGDPVQMNYPTTLPSGASWNTISILILKIFYLIFSLGGKVGPADFNIINSLDA